MAKKLLKLTTLLAILLLVFMLTGCPKPPAEYALTIEKTGNGTVTADPAPNTSGKYTAGTDVTLTAEADAGWQFVRWVVGETEKTENPVVVKMDADKTVKAVFEEEEPPTDKYTLTITKTGQGTVVPAEGAHEYDEGSEVALSATPADGWDFSKWVIDGTDVLSAETTVVMSSNKAANAVFVEEEPPVGPFPKVTNLSFTTANFMVLQPCTENLEIRFQVAVDDPESALVAAEYKVSHVASGESFAVEIPEDNWGFPWTYTVSETLLNTKFVPLNGGKYDITVTATNTEGNATSKTISFYVKQYVSPSFDAIDVGIVDSEEDQIRETDGLCVVTTDGVPGTVEATFTYDSKITVRVYLIDAAAEDGIIGMLEDENTELIEEEQFTTDELTTEKVTIGLPDLRDYMEPGVEYKLLVVLFTPECGALGCVDCGIEAYKLVDCDFIEDLDPELECLPCECENPCDPCFTGYEPGLLIKNLLLTDPAEFDITLTINETVFTNEDFTFIEDPEEGELEVRILIEEGMVTPELSGDTDLYWEVITPTEVELDATCTVKIDFEEPEADIVVENCCVNEGITETTFTVTFSDNIGLQRAKIWGSAGITVELPAGKTVGNWFALSGTEETVAGTITGIDGGYTIYAVVEDDYCIVSEWEKECGINVPPLVDFGPWCHLTECPPSCDATEIELQWGIVDTQGDFTGFEIIVSHGEVDTVDPLQMEGHVTWTLGDIDCETVTATIIAYDDCEGTLNSTTKSWTSPYPMDNVKPEIDLTFADCGEPEECATSAVLAWEASDACLDFVIIGVKQGELIWPDEGLFIEDSDLESIALDSKMDYSWYATTTAMGEIEWDFEDAADCENVEALAIAVDTCGNWNYDELVSENVIDNMEPFVALGVFGLGFNVETDISDVVGNLSEFDLDEFVDEGFLTDLCTDATCLGLVWIVEENCVDDIWLTTNYPLNPCGNEIMERPVGNYTYDPKHISSVWDTLTPEDCWLLDRDVTIGFIPFCLPLIDCETFEATLTADDISECTDEVSDFATITVDNYPPKTTLEWDLTPCSTEVILTWSMTDNSFPCSICDVSDCEIGSLDLVIDEDTKDDFPGIVVGTVYIMTDGTTAWYEDDGTYTVPDEWEIEFDPVTLTYSGTITGEDEYLDCVEIGIDFYAFGCCCYLDDYYGDPNESLSMVVDNVKPLLEVELPDLVIEPLKWCKDEFTTKNASATIEATVTDECFDELVVEVTHGTLPNGLTVWATDVEGFHSLVWDLEGFDGLLDCTKVELTVTAYDETDCEATVFATSFTIDNMPPEIEFDADPITETCGATFVDLDYCIDDDCLTCGDCITMAVAYIEVSSTETIYPITAECGCEVPLCGTFRWELDDIDCGETLVATLVAWDTSGNISKKGITIGSVDNKAPVVDLFEFDGMDTITWNATDNCFDSISIWVSHGSLPDISVFPNAGFDTAQYIPPSFSDQGISFDAASSTTWDLSLTAPGTVTMTLAAYDDCCNETVVATSFYWYGEPN